MTTTTLALLVSARQGAGGTTVFMIQMLVIFAIFYFLLIRPQTKERERHEKMLEAVKKGDDIVTNGGIIGRVIHAEENRLTVKTGENTRLTVDRNRIAQVLGDKDEE